MILEVDNTEWTAIRLAMESEYKRYLEGIELASSEQVKEDFDQTALLYRKILDGLKEQINKQTKD
ncbi:hypothetical protein [Succinivibrio dextrinosolvens]|uniref:Uncharacterized protein n=1 Tax=Succinivibrio dextrinosolvens TaxID=83771 RepID=A0A662Z5Z5_9GAMM|nr:hypothetical protein [Succinivibrio dextrinosolvens]SFJ75012.1 hypothetical protein SAMN04487865_1001152 [Succinivibrio dextrinosolvens]